MTRLELKWFEMGAIGDDLIFIRDRCEYIAIIILSRCDFSTGGDGGVRSWGGVDGFVVVVIVGIVVIVVFIVDFADILFIGWIVIKRSSLGALITLKLGLLLLWLCMRGCGR